MRAQRLHPAILLAAIAAVAAVSASEGSPPPARFAEVHGESLTAEVRAQAEFSAGIGFDTILVPAPMAGRWTEEDAPAGPALDPAFVSFARGSRARGLEIAVRLSPNGSSGFRYSDEAALRRLRKFVRLLARRAGVRSVLLDLDVRETALSDLGDILRFGRVSAPAHLALARSLAGDLGSKRRLWLHAPLRSSRQLADGLGGYAPAFLAGLPDLPRNVGIAWNGPDLLPASIPASAISEARARLGGRPLMLVDCLTPIEGGAYALSAGLGPLRGRDPALPREVAAYLARPSGHDAASRLSLLTVSEYLADPIAYDPEAAWKRAIRRLAGDDSATADALTTQALEWRGWLDGRPFPSWGADTPEAVARLLDDPAFVAQQEWTVRRYPERMATLAGIRDAAFRDGLLTLMDRRLSICRAIPIVLELRVRIAAGRSDIEPLLEALRDEKMRVAPRPQVATALKRFLKAAGVEVGEP